MQVDYILSKIPMRGISQRFRKHYLPLIVESYLKGENPEAAVASVSTILPKVSKRIKISRRAVEKIYSKLRDVVEGGNMLSPNGLLMNTYHIIGEKHSASEFHPPYEIYSKVKQGKNEGKFFYMGYRKFSIVKIKDRLWAISHGKKAIGHLGLPGHANGSSPYNSDISFFEVSKDIDLIDQFCDVIHNTTGLEKSLLVSMIDGSITPGYGGFKEPMQKLLAGISEFKRGDMYNANAAQYLADSIVDLVFPKEKKASEAREVNKILLSVIF
jgi:hypothetical protein